MEIDDDYIIKGFAKAIEESLDEGLNTDLGNILSNSMEKALVHVFKDIFKNKKNIPEWMNDYIKNAIIECADFCDNHILERVDLLEMELDILKIKKSKN